MSVYSSTTVTLVLLSVMSSAQAETLFVDSELADAYHFVETYEVLIDRPPAVVWHHLRNLRSWMVDFPLIHESGPRDAQGEILRIYEGQDFFAEIVKIVPERMIVVANLPSYSEGERMVGVGMFTLTDVDGRSLVSLFMSRHMSGPGGAPDARRARRESDEYRSLNRDLWQDRFLDRLRVLAESDR